MKSVPHWGIVGGGILGMSLALELAEKGMRVTVFEGQRQLGGLTGTSLIGDISWDSFYHVILMSDQHTRGLLRKLDLEEDIRWVESRSGFYSNGALYSMSNLIEFLRFPPLGLIDKIRLGGTIFYASKVRDWRALEGITVEKWLTRLSGKNVFDKIWLPLLRAKLGDLYTQTAASFIWSTIQRLYAARRSGLKKEMFGYLPGGYKRINHSFRQKLESLGVQIRTGDAVERLEMSGQGFEIVANSGKYPFTKVISTLPGPLSSRLIRLPETENAQHEQIRYMGVICPSLVLSKAISPYYVTNIIDKDPPFTGVIEMTALVDQQETGGKHLVYLPRYLDSHDSMFSLSDAEIISTFSAKLLHMYPQLDAHDIVDRHVARARYVFPLPGLNHSQHLPAVRTSIPGYFILNSAQIINGTLNVNDTIRIGKLKLDEIL